MAGGVPGATAAMIVVGPYSAAWAEEFRQLAESIRSTLRDRALRIDHIGSTSVPGLAAKDIVDIQVTVAHLGDAQPLAASGFREIPFLQDHRPPGATGSENDWRKRLFNPPAGERRANIHVREQGRPNQRYALLFRDYLRAHPLAAEAYAELKRRLADSFSDPGRYADVKDPACDLIAVAAEEWASATGWSQGSSDA